MGAGSALRNVLTKHLHSIRKRRGVRATQPRVPHHSDPALQVPLATRRTASIRDASSMHHAHPAGACARNNPVRNKHAHLVCGVHRMADSPAACNLYGAAPAVSSAITSPPPTADCCESNDTCTEPGQTRCRGLNNAAAVVNGVPTGRCRGVHRARAMPHMCTDPCVPGDRGAGHDDVRCKGKHRMQRMRSLRLCVQSAPWRATAWNSASRHRTYATGKAFARCASLLLSHHVCMLRELFL